MSTKPRDGTDIIHSNGGELLNGKSFLVLGEKGTGTSTLAMHFWKELEHSQRGGIHLVRFYIDMVGDVAEKVCLQMDKLDQTEMAYLDPIETGFSMRPTGLNAAMKRKVHSTPLLKRLFGGPAETLHISSFLEGGKTLILRINPDVVGEDTANTILTIVVSQIWHEVKRRAETYHKKHLTPVILVVDKKTHALPQALLSDILLDGERNHFATIFIDEDISKFDSTIRELLMKRTAHFVFHQSPKGIDDYSAYAGLTRAEKTSQLERDFRIQVSLGEERESTAQDAFQDENYSSAVYNLFLAVEAFGRAVVELLRAFDPTAAVFERNYTWARPGLRGISTHEWTRVLLTRIWGAAQRYPVRLQLDDEGIRSWFSLLSNRSVEPITGKEYTVDPTKEDFAKDIRNCATLESAINAPGNIVAIGNFENTLFMDAFRQDISPLYAKLGATLRVLATLYAYLYLHNTKGARYGPVYIDHPLIQNFWQVVRLLDSVKKNLNTFTLDSIRIVLSDKSEDPFDAVAKWLFIIYITRSKFVPPK